MTHMPERTYSPQSKIVINVTISPALAKRFDEVVRKKNTNRTALIREAIEALVKGGK